MTELETNIIGVRSFLHMWDNHIIDGPNEFFVCFRNQLSDLLYFLSVSPRWSALKIEVSYFIIKNCFFILDDIPLEERQEVKGKNDCEKINSYLEERNADWIVQILRNNFVNIENIYLPKLVEDFMKIFY